ncbi:MAG: AbrB/MazE/SpoVT family DNA-binding domain-containing protein [Rhodoferax sp.]|nr:AbrB/MazE/SpoVT family DNA-binding domain-containing protein [Rhodoferax sp.]
MQIVIRNIGNSKGVLLPKPLLAQVGLDDSTVAEVAIEHGAIVLRKPAQTARAGWAQAAQAVAAARDDALLLGEFGNAADADLAW